MFVHSFTQHSTSCVWLYFTCIFCDSIQHNGDVSPEMSSICSQFSRFHHLHTAEMKTDKYIDHSGCVTCTDRIVEVWQITLCSMWWIKTHYLEVGGGTHSNSVGCMKIFHIWQNKHINANCNFSIMVVQQRKCIFTLMIK